MPPTSTPSVASRPRGPRLRARRDEGFALITTVLAMAVLTAFSLVVLQQTISNTAASREDQDWVGALAAAQAGVDDYVSRLNETNGNHTTAATSNAAMGFTSGSPNWAPVPTADGQPQRGLFHYDVDASGYTGTSSVVPNGNIVVTSTGKVGARTRTVQATVRRSGFVDYVYFSDLETPDPLTYTTGLEAAVANCNKYWYASRPGPPTCTDTAFRNDRLTGPVHSNDTMLICEGVEFQDSVTTASPPVAANDGKHYRIDGKSIDGTAVPCPSTGTSYLRAGDPRQVTRINMPSTNLALKHETSASATQRGCLFVGPTRITIRGAEIRVKSPWTKVPTPGCRADDQYFPIPVAGVVYVDVVPAATAVDDNAPSATETCDATKNVGVPYTNPVSGLTETDWRYPCRAGDVFIEQEGGLQANALDGRLTVSANNNLYITDHLDYAKGTAGDDFLGLIAEQFVYVWHPVHRDNSSPPVETNLKPFVDPRISAALLSVNHAVAVQHHRYGSAMGTLRITGAMTQKYRGSVSTTGGANGPTGYTKDYVYDQRLRYDAPPRYLNPLISSFTAVRTAETAPAYR